MKKALITGVSGQDGAYLAKWLLEHNYEVYGTNRRNSVDNLERLDVLNIRDKVQLIDADLCDYYSLMRAFREVQPDEVYNLAAQSFVGVSWDVPVYTFEVNAKSVLHMLEIIREFMPETRFYQASTSEMFGQTQGVLNEESSFYPRSPYGVAKLSAYWFVRNYRESFGLFACNGILFNHESPLRGEAFVTKKITRAFAKMKHGLQDVLEIGNLNAKRDWGFAQDYVRGMWQMLQIDQPDDFVLATGTQSSIREFIILVSQLAGFSLTWEGSGLDEVAKDQDGVIRVRVNETFYRPAEVDNLIGDYSKFQEVSGWKPEVGIEQLAQMMFTFDEQAVLSRSESFA